jgi:hypothetical protein
LTVTAGPREITSACTGALLEFPCPNFARPTDVQVYLLDGPGAANEDGTLLVDGDDYTISGSGEDGSAKIETAVAYPFGQWIRAFRVSEGAQVAEYEVNQGFPAAATEYELDRLTLRDAELSGDTSDVENRALRVPRGETAAVLPGPDDRKGSLLGFSLFTGVRELLTYANVSALLAPFLTPLLAAINKGDPGGNIMAIGLFLAGGTLNIPVGTNIVRTSGYSADGKGGAFYQYDAAVDAAYVAAHPRSAFVSANGRGFRLSLDQQINVCMFGAVGDDAANDGAAFVAALAFCFAAAQAGTGFGDACPPLLAPFGRFYLGAQTLDITHTIDFFGAGGSPGGAATQLRWDDATTGIRFQNGDTTGDTGTGAQAYPGSGGSQLRRMYLKGGYSGVESEHHGVLRRATVHLEDLFIDNFPGDAVATIAGADANGGNANRCSARRVKTPNCRDGFRNAGADSNAGSAMDIDVSNVRRWGVNDRSFLGNLWNFNCETSGKTPGSIPTIVSHDGFWYSVVDGQEAGAAVNAPSGTTADNQWWYYRLAGAPDVVANVPAWFNGIVVRAGGPIRTTQTTAPSYLLRCQMEPFQGPMQLTPPTLVIGGFIPGNGVRGVSTLRNTPGGLETDDFAVLRNAVFGNPFEAVPRDNIVVIETTGANGSIMIRHWAGGVATIPANFQGHSGSGAFITGDPAISFFVPDGLAAGIDAAGFNIYGRPLKIDGLQVVGPRQGAIGNAVNAAAAPTQAEFNALVGIVNDLRDMAVAHGLIQP